jgi:ABC-type multidrug transport system fused ATPase/permease subunit
MGIVFTYFIFYSNNLASLLSFLILFATAAYRLMPSLNRILNSLVKMKSGIYLFDILGEYETSIKISKKYLEKDIKKIKFQNEIQLSDITFSYDKKQNNVLENISLSIKKGDCVGIIGESGSGKTTLISLLLGLIVTDNGTYTIDNVKINKNNIVSLQNIIGYVQQTLYLKDGNIIENIAYGKEQNEIDFNLLNRCIKDAMLEDFIKKLPEGLETKVGEFGAKVSGGQKQRIAIARALYNKPEIIILDEATSALDNFTEKEFLKTITKLQEKNITIISIAHRLSSLVNCNKIYQIENGLISKRINKSD